LAAAGVLAAAGTALAEPAPPAIDGADTAWVILATALVVVMSIPGLAFFYFGMVRQKNVLAAMGQDFVRVAAGSLLWALFCYSLAFSGEGSLLGTLDRALLRGIDMATTSPLAATIPELLFVAYQMTFAVITLALVAGSVVDRMRFSAFVWFSILWIP